MTAFADYLDLRSAVVDTVGSTQIVDVFDRLTKLAEARLNRELRLADQITSTTITVASGTGALPADFREVVGVFDSTGCEYIARPVADVQGTHSTYYAIDGSNLIANDREYTVKYYADLSTLTASLTTSNWLLQKYPEVYLYAVAAEAAKHIKDENFSIYEGYRERAMAEARADDSRWRNSRLRVRVQGVTP